MGLSETLIAIAIFGPLMLSAIFVIIGTLSIVSISKTLKGLLEELKKTRESLERQKG
jgi:hypothetical protein